MGSRSRLHLVRNQLTQSIAGVYEQNSAYGRMGILLPIAGFSADHGRNMARLLLVVTGVLNLWLPMTGTILKATFHDTSFPERLSSPLNCETNSN